VSTLKEELNYKTILKFSLDILQALEYLHSNKIIHMSLRPKNVLISKDGILKLTDYGFVEYKDHYYRTQYIQQDFPELQCK
jgi:serine/threonine protein kinase